MPKTITILLFLFLLLAGSKIIYHVIKKKKLQKHREALRKQKGKDGESDTAGYISQIRGRKKLVCNVFIPIEGGTKTTEIDLILIHQKGIFVIENKNYTGWICGDEDSKNWLQILNSRKRFEFYNPVMQNKRHIRHLKYFLKQELPFTEEIPFISVVTFNHQARLKRIFTYSDDVIVTNSRKIRKKIMRRMWRMKKVLNRAEIEQVSRLLSAQTHPSEKIIKQHNLDVKHYQKDYKS